MYATPEPFRLFAERLLTRQICFPDSMRSARFGRRRRQRRDCCRLRRRHHRQSRCFNSNSSIVYPLALNSTRNWWQHLVRKHDKLQRLLRLSDHYVDGVRHPSCSWGIWATAGHGSNLCRCECELRWWRCCWFWCLYSRRTDEMPNKSMLLSPPPLSSPPTTSSLRDEPFAVRVPAVFAIPAGYVPPLWTNYFIPKQLRIDVLAT